MSESQKAAAEAVKGLLSLADGFPFASERDKSAWLAGLLTVAFRRQIRGPVPMFWIWGEPSTGKTLLANHTARLGTQKEPCRIASSQPAIETAVRAQTPMVIIDNAQPLNRAICSLLCSMITSGEIAERRVCGGGCEYHQNTVFWATGTGVYASSDLRRRIIPIELSARLIEDVHNGWLKPVRSGEFADMDSALLTKHARLLLDNYRSARKPSGEALASEPDENRRLRFRSFCGCFEHWSRMIREPLIFAGLPDPVLFTSLDEKPRKTKPRTQPSAEQ